MGHLEHYSHSASSAETRRRCGNNPRRAHEAEVELRREKPPATATPAHSDSR